MANTKCNATPWMAHHLFFFRIFLWKWLVPPWTIDMDHGGMNSQSHPALCTGWRRRCKVECSLHMAICLLAASKSFLSIQLAKRTHLLAHPWGSRGRHLGLDGNAGLVKDLGSGGPAGEAAGAALGAVVPGRAMVVGYWIVLAGLVWLLQLVWLLRIGLVLLVQILVCWVLQLCLDMLLLQLLLTCGTSAYFFVASGWFCSACEGIGGRPCCNLWHSTRNCWLMSAILPNTLVSRPLDSFLHRCNASLIMALAMHDKPSGAFPVCWRSCQLATMAFSTCKDSGLAFSLPMSLFSSNFATPSTILGEDRLAQSMEALSHGNVVVVSLNSR